MDLEYKEERPQSEASSGSRGVEVPTTPPPTYLWEELRRSRSKGGYPWTILDKEPLPDNVDVELLLKGEIPKNWFDTEHLRSRSANADKRMFKNRLRDRERSRRARSEPTPSVLSSSNASLSIGMDQAMAANPSNYESTDIDDFLLGDEDIPDFVMAYLQSDKGNLDEDIPSNILEYIQSRAAILEKHQQLHHQQSDEIFYTENELRIIDEARKRLEERGELNLSPLASKEVVEIDNFDYYFQIPVVNQGNSSNPEVITVEPENINEPGDSKKGQRFKFKNISMPTKAQLAMKLPKMSRGKKAKKESEEQHGTELADKKKRPHSLSPMRQKINQQFSIWNDSLKKFKVPGRRPQEHNQNKSFVALFAGARYSSKPKIDNQYEEIGACRPELINNPLVITVTEPETLSNKKAKCSVANENEGTEETMEGIENLPESEIIETHLGAIGRDAREEKLPAEVLSDVDINGGELEEHGDTEIKTKKGDLPKSTPLESKGLAARSKKAFQTTKSKIQTSLSKDQLEATRKKLHATRKKVKSTLSKQNLQATRNIFQTTLNSTLKRKKRANPPDPLLLIPTENIFSKPFQDETRDYETSTPIKMKDERKNPALDISNEEFLYEMHSSAPTINTRLNKKNIPGVSPENDDCFKDLKSRTEIKIIEEEIEENLEEEIEPKLEFFLHGTHPVRPPSINRSTETLPEESEKENVVIRPKRQRYRNRRLGFYDQMEEPLNDQNSTSESNDNWTYFQKPEKPTRSRSKKSLASLTNDHIYSNVPPMRRKRRQPKNISQQANTSTWPRQDIAIVEQPVVPKRLKSKSTKISIDCSLGSENQTWPRRSLIKNTPSAPQRKRVIEKNKITNCPIEDKKKILGTSSMELDQNKSIYNILVDADVLFGVESRFIDEDNKSQKIKAYSTNITEAQEDSCMKLDKVKPLNNILAEADTLFGAESRFIDEEVSADDIKSNAILREHFDNKSVLINCGQSKFSNETKTIDGINTVSGPSAPSRHRKCSKSLRKQNSLKNCGIEDATWPRMSKHQPSTPRRGQKSGSKEKNIPGIIINESCVQLERSSKEPLTPIVPSSTPLDPLSAGADSIQAGLDHILEILATLPQETSTNIDITNHEKDGDKFTPQVVQPFEEESTENPYAEIKQLQKKKPLRPPPPIYHVSSSSSYSYIYTVPRRKKRINQTVSPERPPRNYCTIRPHRPPRKHRSFRSPPSNQTETDTQNEENSRRHSFSGTSNAQDENIHQAQRIPIDSETAPCWMLSRPLPAPPRVKRSRSPPQKPPRNRASSSSLQRRKSVQNDDIEVKEECSQVLAPQTENSFIPNEYEPIEDPVKVEETSIGIQTDPPLDDDESNIINLEAIDEDGSEFKNNSEVVGHLQIDSINETSQEAYESCQLVSSLEPDTGIANTDQPTITLLNTGSHSPVNTENQHTAQKHTPKLKKGEEKIEQKQESKCKKCEQAENSEFMSHIPINFQRPIPQPHRPIRIEFPTRLQLLELDVDRLTVREVIADRLTVSQVEANTLDTSTLEVSQMTSSSGQLIFNVGSNAATIPSTIMSISESEAKDEVIENVRTETTPVRVATTIDTTREEERSPEPQIVSAVAHQTKVESKKETFKCSSQTTYVNRERVSPLPLTITTVPPPSVSDLTAQLVGLSSQHLARFGCAAATETWEIAQRVARLGFEQVNKQLQRQGLYSDDTEKENAKAILMVLLILVAAIFLLGMGRVPHRLSNHWEFYFTN